MLINRHKRYIKKHRIGGSGIFNVLTRMLTSAAASDLGKTAISAGKTAAKELATAAISAAKDAAIEKGKQFISKRQSLTQKSKDILDNIVKDGGAVRIEDLVRGRGLKLAL